MEKLGRLRRLYFRDGMALSEIARKTGFARNTVKMLHAPSNGSAPLLTDVLAGHVNMTFDSYTVYEEHQGGQVSALGVTAKRRLAMLPQVPTIAEAGQSMGLAGYHVSNWLCVPRSHACAKAPPPTTG